MTNEELDLNLLLLGFDKFNMHYWQITDKDISVFIYSTTINIVRTKLMSYRSLPYNEAIDKLKEMIYD